MGVICTRSQATRSGAHGSAGLLQTTPRRSMASLVACRPVSSAIAMVWFTVSTCIQSVVRTVGKDGAPSTVTAGHIQARPTDAQPVPEMCALLHAPFTNNTAERRACARNGCTLACR